MSELKTNKISTNDGNNVAIDNSLNLKSYTTTQRDALTSAAGDMIYNTTDSVVQFHNGTTWVAAGSGLLVEYVLIAGGGSGGTSIANNVGGGGGGAGGYISSFGTESSGGGGPTGLKLLLTTSVGYSITVGAGGSGIANTTSNVQGNPGNNSAISSISVIGGGYGGKVLSNGGAGGSGGGAGGYSTATGGAGTANQGYAGGNAVSGRFGTAGGGGAGAVGGNAHPTDNSGGDGGAGVASSITGSSVTRAGGGGGTGSSGGHSGGTGGGGDGGAGSTAGSAGTAYTGGGGGAGNGNGGVNGSSGNGGSGVVILRYPNSFTAALSGGATSTSGEQTTGSDKYIQIESTGTVTFS